jgi:hypothetical protein
LNAERTIKQNKTAETGKNIAYNYIFHAPASNNVQITFTFYNDIDKKKVFLKLYNILNYNRTEL